MPVVAFDQLPDDARVWIFASDRPLRDAERDALLADVDAFLAQWKAHGAPLRSAREWRENQFLVIGVDPTLEQASGCSIDVLFRGLQTMEGSLGTSLVAGGRVFYRDNEGQPRMVKRPDVGRLAASGVIGDATPVFDTSLTSASAYRARFELPAGESWVAVLMRPQASQSSSPAATNSSSARNG